MSRGPFEAEADKFLDSIMNPKGPRTVRLPPQVVAECHRVLRLIGVEEGNARTDEARAVHEAGHVVVGVRLGRVLDSGVEIGERYSGVYFERSDDADPTAAELHIKTAIAGPIAEATDVGSSSGWGGDIPGAVEAMASIDGDQGIKDALYTRFASEVRAILGQAPVAALAQVILAKRRLSKRALMGALRTLNWPPEQPAKKRGATAKKRSTAKKPVPKRRAAAASTSRAKKPATTAKKPAAMRPVTAEKKSQSTKKPAAKKRAAKKR